MEFIFDRPDDPAQERYEIALLLDRKKLKERILIGIRAKIQRRLQGVKDAAVFLDVERELGTLLTEFTQDKEKAWNQYGTMPLIRLHRYSWCMKERPSPHNCSRIRRHPDLGRIPPCQNSEGQK